MNTDANNDITTKKKESEIVTFVLGSTEGNLSRS